MSLTPGTRLGPYEIVAPLGGFLISAPTGEAVIPVNVCLNWLAGAKK